MKSRQRISIGYITSRGAGLFEIYTPRAAGLRLCKSRRDRTEWCNRLVPGATWPWQHIYGLATTAPAIKRLKRVPSNSSNHRIVAAETDSHRIDARHRVDNACCQRSTPAFFLLFSDVAVLLCAARSVSLTGSIVVHDCSCFYKLLTRLNEFNRSTHSTIDLPTVWQYGSTILCA